VRWFAKPVKESYPFGGSNPPLSAKISIASKAIFCYPISYTRSMKKEIEINKRKVEYTLKISKRSKKLRLAIYCDGNFVVTMPKNIPVQTAENFILRKSSWVLKKLNYLETHRPEVTKYSSSDILDLKERAAILVSKKLEEFNSTYGYRFNKVTIRSQKTRWGSCSKRGNLSFNWRIALLPERMVDYIVVHELCHLGEFNHSPEFWELVKRTVPDYQSVRKELNLQHIQKVD
jgi:predicted metal-dependent hydrolase